MRLNHPSGVGGKTRSGWKGEGRTRNNKQEKESMFGFGRKNNERGVNTGGVDKEKKKRVEKDQGPAWVSVMILVASVLAGVFFWVYGKLTQGEWVNWNGVGPMEGNKVNNSDREVEKGVIIFERDK